MTGMGSLIAATVAFVGLHLLLSHPRRKPLVSAIKARVFLGLYSLVAAGTRGTGKIGKRVAGRALAK